MSGVVVVGGGIAGLSAAIALGSTGNEVLVVERSSEFTEVGAGISLWPNALRALRRLGVLDQVCARSTATGPTKIRTHSGRTLADGVETDLRYGTIQMIHRAELLEILRRRAADLAEMSPGLAVTNVDANGVVRGPGLEIEADLVVGADGLRSVTRRSVMRGAPRPRYVGQTAWRAVTAPVPLVESGEMWGRGLRFGYAPLPDGRAYCFAVANALEGKPGGGVPTLRRRFARWADPVGLLLSEVSKGDLLHHDLYELPALRTYVTGRVVLIGDAAHAMTPNLGQGAALGLEDAVDLADAWTTGDLVDFDATRRARAELVSRRSHRIGAVGQWHNPAAVALRNGLMRAVPGSSVARSIGSILSWPDSAEQDQPDEGDRGARVDP